MSTAAGQTMNQLEMQEERNKKMIEAEEKRREREQIHMESQVRNTMELARQKKRIVERDHEKVRKMEEINREAEKKRVSLAHIDEDYRRENESARRKAAESQDARRSKNPKAGGTVQQDQKAVLGHSSKGAQSLASPQRRPGTSRHGVDKGTAKKTALREDKASLWRRPQKGERGAVAWCNIERTKTISDQRHQSTSSKSTNTISSGTTSMAEALKKHKNSSRDCLTLIVITTSVTCSSRVELTRNVIV